MKSPNKLFKHFALLFFVTTMTMVLGTNNAHAQSMGISSGAITPDASSILELRTTTKGLLIPRLTTTERDAISSPATGLVVYNTSTNKFNFYNGSAWTILLSGSGTVISVSGTSNRITVGGTSSDPVIDIASAYVGQSSITTLGTIGTGIWNGTFIDPVYGGTGVNNGTKTITLGGNLTTSGAFATTLTSTAATNVTLPVTGTLATLAGTETFTNKTISGLNNTLTNIDMTSLTGTLGVANGGSGATTLTGIIKGNGTSAFTAATSGTDYSAGTSALATGILKSTTSTGALTIAVAGDFPTLNQNTTGTATKATNLVGGNATTLLGSLPYQSNTDVTTLLSPNTTTTKKFLTQTGDGTNGAAPGWNTIVAGDVPTLNQSTTGSAATLTTGRNIYGNSFNGSADLTQIIASTYGGTGNGFAKLSGPATSEKTFTLPNASATILTDNTAVTAAQGGTGNTSYTVGDILYASASTTLSKLAGVATGNALISGGTSTAPSWGKIGLTTHVSGTLPIANGGTNSATSLNNNRIIVSSGSAIVEASALTNGQLLIGSTGAAPVAATLTAGNGITITNAAGSITIANEPTITQATSTTDATTTSLTDVLITGMTVTPGAGDYIVVFTGSYENTNSNKQGPISIYNNGTQIAASVVQCLSPGNQATPIATQAYITGLGAGQAIEVKWKVLANTGTFHQRTMIVQKVK